MTKKFVFLAICAVLLALAGCGTPAGTYISNGVNDFENFVTSPKTQATAATLAKATVVFVCNVSAVANIAGQVEVAAGAGQSTIGTNGKVYAASSAACSGLGGLVSGTTTAPAGAVVVQ